MSATHRLCILGGRIVAQQTTTEWRQYAVRLARSDLDRWSILVARLTTHRSWSR
jgi:hypothetical protein